MHIGKDYPRGKDIVFLNTEMYSIGIHDRVRKMYRTRREKCLEQQCEKIKDDHGSMLIELNQVKKRWTEYNTSLYLEASTIKRPTWRKQRGR